MRLINLSDPARAELSCTSSSEKYIYICKFSVLDYFIEDIHCFSEFHASYEAIIRQLSKIADTCEDIQNLKIQNNA